MTAPQTLPISRPPLPVAHEHAWLTESRHQTSDGAVLYVRCAACGIRRVDVQERSDATPAAISRITR